MIKSMFQDLLQLLNLEMLVILVFQFPRIQGIGWIFVRKCNFLLQEWLKWRN